MYRSATKCLHDLLICTCVRWRVGDVLVTCCPKQISQSQTGPNCDYVALSLSGLADSPSRALCGFKERHRNTLVIYFLVIFFCDLHLWPVSSWHVLFYQCLFNLCLFYLWHCYLWRIYMWYFTCVSSLGCYLTKRLFIFACVRERFSHFRRNLATCWEMCVRWVVI